MEAFEYASPKTRQEAVKLLAGRWGETEVLAGGTDLVSAMKDRISTPKRLVSLQHVAGLGGVEYSARDGLRLGAMLTLRAMMDHPDVKRHYPALVDAAQGIRSEQLRHMGTLGGELLQRPRCWYYRNGYGLLARYEAKSLVPDGDNRYHAILGNAGPAYFVSPSSLAPLLIALGAKVKLFGPSGEREIPLEHLFTTPTREGEREHTLKPDEVLTEIQVPAHHAASAALYEVRQKEGLDWPLAAAAAVLHLEGGRVAGARVVLGHVAPVPWPSPEAEQALRGKPVNEESAEAAGQAAVAKATPLSMNGYKVQLARVAVQRAVLKAVQGGVHA